MTELSGERDELVRLHDGGGAIEQFELHGDLGAALVAVHSEGASEFVGDVGGLLAVRFGEAGGCCGGGDLVEDVEALFECGEMALPEFCDEGVGFRCGFRSHKVRMLSRR